jgi:YfiH family protein
MILPLASGVIAPVAPGDRPAFWAVTGRLGGHSVGEFSQANIAQHVGDDPDAVARNLEELGGLVQVQGRELALMQPIHGNGIGRVTHPGMVIGVDSLVTEECGMGLVAMGADCVPLILYGSRGHEKPIISAVHCGWKGLVAGVVTATITELRLRGANEIQSIVGPAICGSCYLVSPDRRELVRTSTPADVSKAALGVAGGIDVRAGVLSELTRERVGSQVIGGCTFENPETLFSYRKNDGRTGRQGIIIAMHESRERS